MRLDQQADLRRDFSPRWSGSRLVGQGRTHCRRDKLVKERLNEKGNVVEIVDLGLSASRPR